jgi:4-amino-4-deoxy-L-arabinose transferase-like glycosyltransferase
MKSERWHWLLLILVGMGLFSVRLGNTHLWDQDEGYYAAAASEMYAKNDWVVPSFNGELFAHKPPLMFWGMMLGYSGFGVSELGARFVSSLFGIGTILLTYQLARRLFDSLTGLMSGLAIGSCIMFTMVARSATADAHLTFLVLLSLSIWMNGYLRAIGLNRDAKLRSIPWFVWIAAYAVMGLGVLTKGPIGFLFPMAVIGLFLLNEQERAATDSKSAGARLWRTIEPYMPFSFFQTLWRMRPITAVACILAVAGPWYCWVQIRTDGAFLREFIGIHHMGRFSGAMDNHSGPIYYYVAACLLGMYPWSAFAIPTFIQVFRECVSPVRSFAMRFVVCWAAVYLVIFSLAGTKLPNYVLPAYPALAIFCGRFFAVWMTDIRRVNPRWLHLGWALMILVGFTITLGFPAMSFLSSEGQTILDRFGLDSGSQQRMAWFALAGVPLCLFGTLGWFAFGQGKWKLSGVAFALGALGLIGLMTQFVAPQVDRWQGAQRMAESFGQENRMKGFVSVPTENDTTIVVLGQFRPSLVFYFGQAIHFSSSNEDAIEKSKSSPDSMLITTEKHLQELQDQLPRHSQVIERIGSLPGQDKLLVVGPETIRR